LNEFKAFIDVETTGFDYLNNDIVSLCCIITDQNLRIQKIHTSYVIPDNLNSWSDHAERVHGFTKFDVMRKPFVNSRKSAIGFLTFLKEFKHENNYPMEFVSHSNGFDFKMLLGMFIKNDLQFSLYKIFNQRFQTSTIKLARKAYQLKSYKLGNICEHLGIELDAHEVVSDTKACFEIYRRIQNEDGIFQMQ